MAIYIGSLILVLIKPFLLKVSRIKKSKLIYVVIVGFILFFISAVRDIQVGTDLPVYVTRFNLISNTSGFDLSYFNERWGFEYGFLYLNKALSLIGGGERFFIIFTSGFIISSFTIFIYKYSKIPWLSFYLFIVLYFFGTSLNLIRMFIAISICLTSINYLNHNNLYKFSLVVTFASLFHTTAIAFFILYPLSKIKLNTKYLILVSGLILTLGLLGSRIINIVLNVFGYQQYLSYVGSGDGISMLILLVSIILLTLILKKTNNLTEDNGLNLLLQMLILAVGFNVLSLQLTFAARVMWYFKTALLILIPNVIANLKSNDIKGIGLFLVIILPLIYFNIMSSADTAGIVPYIFMWE